MRISSLSLLLLLAACTDTTAPDSLVVMDNFRWLTEGVDAGITP
jgi:hypothetical protein